MTNSKSLSEKQLRRLSGELATFEMFYSPAMCKSMQWYLARTTFGKTDSSFTRVLCLTAEDSPERSAEVIYRQMKVISDRGITSLVRYLEVTRDFLREHHGLTLERGTALESALETLCPEKYSSILCPERFSIKPAAL